MLNSKRDSLISYISDAYKDLHGMRPRFYNWDVMTVAQLTSEANELSDALDYEINREKIELDRNMDTFMQFAPNADTAKRWIEQSLGEYA